MTPSLPSMRSPIQHRFQGCRPLMFDEVWGSLKGTNSTLNYAFPFDISNKREYCFRTFLITILCVISLFRSVFEYFFVINLVHSILHTVIEVYNTTHYLMMIRYLECESCYFFPFVQTTSDENLLVAVY